MLVLGIESTCDETSCAIVEDGTNILSNVISSQIDLHKPFGGVVPELACRRHVDVFLPILQESLKQANLNLGDIDLIAVAHGPGLIGALLIGLNAAKSLALALNKPFIGVNHVEAHLYAAMMSQSTLAPFPHLGVVISGGHTALVKIHDLGHYELIGQTVDDAIGEAFDKVAKLLNLPYPGGPQIEQLALSGDPKSYPFKPGNVKGKPFDFSFSGLKTKVLYTLKGQNLSAENLPPLTPQKQKNIAASFQHAALRDIIDKTLKAASLHQCNAILFGGGVSNNQRLRQLFTEASPSTQFYWPGPGLSLDNAAMIAGLGFHRYQRQTHGDSYDLEALTRIQFS
jgi:N6-L-threonylcarbamoyladenine synthase